MTRVLLSLCLLLAAVACRSTPAGPVELVGPRMALLRADLEQAYEAVPRAAARVGYGWHEVRRDAAQVVMRTPPEQAFFSMVGEQVRFQEAVARFREVPDGVEVHVDATLVHGPPGGPYERKERVGQGWYDEFFAALTSEMEPQPPEHQDAPSVEP